MIAAFRRAPPGLALALLPEPALAHGGLPGGGGFYSGAAHPFLAVEQFVALAALGLLIGAHPGPGSRAPLAVLALGLALGLAFGLGPAIARPALLALTLLTGILLATALPVPLAARAALAGAIGWVVGADTDVPRPEVLDLFAAGAPYAGVFVGVFLICLNAVALASIARSPVPRIAVRVAGSWAAAIALMVLALQLRPTGT